MPCAGRVVEAEPGVDLEPVGRRRDDAGRVGPVARSPSSHPGRRRGSGGLGRRLPRAAQHDDRARLHLQLAAGLVPALVDDDGPGVDLGEPVLAPLRTGQGEGVLLVVGVEDDEEVVVEDAAPPRVRRRGWPGR